MRWAKTTSTVPTPVAAPSLEPIERFIREVIPAVPGGRQRIMDSRGHDGLIKQAAVERGLTLRTIGRTTYFYAGRLPVGGMTGWVPSLVSAEALAVSISKDWFKQMLEAAGVPTPSGIAVGTDQFDDAVAHLAATRRPQVLKPTSGRQGKGITTGITTEDDLRTAWDIAVAGNHRSLVLEEQTDGVDIRAFVVGRRVVAATTRIHAHVVGDGRQSITELIAEKQEWRDEHIILRKRPFTVDPAILARTGHAMDTVPADGEVVVVNGLANIHMGGESVDVTELVHPDLVQIAVDAVRAVPGLGLAGIDILVPDIGSADGAVVLEANVSANVRVHHCPAYGRSRDVAGTIIDEMIATAHA
jgi:D-alanine-D-alanine ligase-like ATP-grasp enzyme